MSTKDKPNRLQARLPRGFADRSPAEMAETQRLIGDIRKVYELYGFEPLETPTIEYSDALGKFLPDQDRPNEGVFSFKDDDDQWLSLRYDLTAPLARFVAENFDRLPKPYRSYRFGWVFRNESPVPVGSGNSCSLTPTRWERPRWRLPARRCPVARGPPFDRQTRSLGPRRGRLATNARSHR